MNSESNTVNKEESERVEKGGEPSGRFKGEGAKER